MEKLLTMLLLKNYITNTAPMFQYNIKAMLSRLLWKKCIINIDNIIIFGFTF